jgi:hypothetical protein
MKAHDNYADDVDRWGPDPIIKRQPERAEVVSPFGSYTPGWSARIAGGRTFEQFVAEAPPVIERFKRWNVDELLAADLTLSWLVRGMLCRPTYGVDTGELKTLKSYFGMARAIGIAAGVPVLNHFHVPARDGVLYYVAEGGRIPFTRRLIRMCEAHGIGTNDLESCLEVVFDAGPLDSVQFRESLRSHLRESGPMLVHLDPLYPFQPMTVDSNKLNQVGLMLNEIQAICAEYDATLWITAHMNQTGNGFDLKRISGAGVGEWGDSWCLLKHRETPDVAAGKFRLGLDIGSRQWGGASYDVDFNIGRFDVEAGTHDGPITFKVRPSNSPDEIADRDADKRLLARRGVLATMRKARTALTRTEIEDRTTGAGKVYIRAEIAALIDDNALVEHGIRKPEKGGKEAPMYLLAKGSRGE